MREIKFRAKSKHNSKKWVYGTGIVPVKNNTYDTDEYEMIQEVNYDELDYYYPDYDAEDIDINTLGQYTGLKDKNGKEIYERDIIDFSYDMFVGNFNTFVAKGIVIFEEGAFYVQCLENERLTKDESYLLYTINIDTIEVIGNIYDNPELLKEEK